LFVAPTVDDMKLCRPSGQPHMYFDNVLVTDDNNQFDSNSSIAAAHSLQLPSENVFAQQHKTKKDTRRVSMKEFRFVDLFALTTTFEIFSVIYHLMKYTRQVDRVKQLI
jgi:hypothetical protein